MKMEDKIIEHLKTYRAKHGKTQKEMAALMHVSYRTYQDMETLGIVKKIDALNRLKELTGFKSTQENALVAKDTLENLMILTRKEVTLLRATARILTLKLINLESKATKRPFDEVSLDVQKKIAEEMKHLEDELHKE
jgi:transcriptional regulator with XRE-family HTH domain